MKYFKSIFKISIILLLLIITLGSVSAVEDGDSAIDDGQDDDFDLDEDLDEDSDDDDLDDDSDDNLDDDDDDLDDDSDDDLDDDDLDDDLDDDDNFTDYDYLEMKILLYLDKYGNCSDENWTESENFLSEYQIYLADPSSYSLNESAEGYETYVKIYDSITSTFKDYNLTENETAYLKFLIIYYLNNYGNVSANYTWNESDDFSRFYPDIMCLYGAFYGCASAPDIAYKEIPYFYSSLNNVFSPILGNSTDNETSNSTTVLETPQQGDSWWSNILILVLVVILVFLVII